MLKSLYLFLVLSQALHVLYAIHDTIADAAPGAATTRANHDCDTDTLSRTLMCRGSRAIRNVINNLNKSDKPIVIVRGLQIVRSNQNTSVTSDDYSNPIDDSFVGRFSEYLRTHELNIKFSDLLAEESQSDLERNGLEIGNANDSLGVGVGARKKDKGQGMLMAMALMFGKMMAVMGLGGIGALAMKALGVAMAALMMAGIVGLKSLTQNGGGHESSHSVQYLSADGGHHHIRRRRRSLDLLKQLYKKKQTNEPYNGWLHNSNGSKD